MAFLTGFVCALLLASCVQGEPPSAPSLPTGSPSSSVAAPGRTQTDRPILYECDEDICSISRSGRHRRVVIEQPGTQYLASWAPDGRLFSYLDVADRGADLWIAEKDGSRRRRVARNVDEFYDWAPDSGRLIVSRSSFIDYTLGFDSDLYVVDADGGDSEQLTDSDLSESSPVWSPDGDSIAFTGAARSSDEVNLDIYTLRVDSGEVTRLTSHAAQDWEPRWSPDGSKLAFLSARHDPYDSESGPYTAAIYLVDVGTRREKRLTRGDRSDDREHDWSPDGSAIAYARGWDDDVAHRRPAITVVALDGTVAVLGRGSEPAWSPDGRYIAFGRDGRDSELFLIESDGTGERALTANRTHDSRPAW